jgi:hypothetical protein
VGHVAGKEMKNSYTVLVEISSRPRHRWENTIKTDLKDVMCGDENWIQLA